MRESERTWTYQTAIPEIKKFLEAENYVAAYTLARKAEKIIPNDPALNQSIEMSSAVIDIQTTPPGASVSYKSYSDIDGGYIQLGVTPMDEDRLPIGMHRWQIKKEGYQEREVAWGCSVPGSVPQRRTGTGQASWGGPFSLQLNLYEENRVPKGTISVDRRRFIMALGGLPPDFNGMELDHFFIDRTEVTNRAFKEFIDAGGYSQPEFVETGIQEGREGDILARSHEGLCGSTGRPGPSTWELGGYPEGQEDYPVSGVSWFEAAAYAEFRGKSLPPPYIIGRGRLPFSNRSCKAIKSLYRSSEQFRGSGPAKVGTYPGIGSSGARTWRGMYGSGAGTQRATGAIAWEGCGKTPRTCSRLSIVLSPWDRSPGNGFRCAVYPEGTSVASKLFQEINLAFHDPYSIPPLSEEALRIYRSTYSYPAAPLRPVLEATDESGRDWKRETVTVDAAYGRERYIIHLYLPASDTPRTKR